MPSTALADRPAHEAVTSEQLVLIKKTVAAGATDAELALYLHDCQRQGVHPLDRLLHFTKRGGKYTPVTSIDLMRIRAAETGEYAGSDDATFEFDVSAVPKNERAPLSATVTVWRLVVGTRCPFTATARWSEYYPGESSGHMWKKMPHTMLAKCAEALALRKGFPRQLAGLYAREELDQADSSPSGYVVEAPPASPPPSSVRDGQGTSPDVGTVRVHPSAGDSGVPDGPDHHVDLPAGARLILKVEPGKAGAAASITLSGEARPLLTWNKKLADAVVQWCQRGVPVFPEFKTSATGNRRIEDLVPVPDDYDPSEPLADTDSVF